MNDPHDRFAIQGVIDQYFFGIDRCDPAMIRACFADEAGYTSDAGTLDMASGDEIGSRLGRGGCFAQTSHLRSSQHIAVSGDRASADTFAIAYLVEDVAAGGIIHVRGLQYRDELVRKADGWKIVHRHHSTKWQFQQTASDIMPV